LVDFCYEAKTFVRIAVSASEDELFCAVEMDALSFMIIRNMIWKKNE